MKTKSKRQRNVFESIMINWGAVEKATVSATNSAGSYAKEQEAYFESISGHLSRLESAWQSFTTNSLNSGFVKSILDITTSMVKLADVTGGALPVVLSLGTAFLVFKNATTGNFLANLINQFTVFTIGVKSAETGLIALSIAEKATIAGAIIGGITAVGLAYNYFAGRADKAKESVSALSTELKDLQDKSQNIQQLGYKYLELKPIKNKTVEQLQEYTDTQNQLRAIMPELNGYIDEQGNYHLTEINTLSDLTSVYKEYIDLKRQEKAIASQESAKYTSDDYDETIAKIKTLNSYLDGSATKPISMTGMSDEDIQKRITDLQSTISGLVSDMQNNIADQIINDDSWDKIDSATKDNILKMLSEQDDGFLASWNDNISRSTDGVKSLIYYLSELSNKTKENTSTIIPQKTEYVKLQEAYQSGKISIAEYSKQLDELNKTSQQYKTELSDLGIVQNYLNDIIKKVTDNQSLSEDEVNSLVSLYPQLESAIYKTADGWSIENDVINLVNESVTDLKTTYINVQNLMTSSMAQQAFKRIENIGIEIESIQSLADAYRAVATAMDIDTSNMSPEQEAIAEKLISRSDAYAPVLDLGMYKSQINKLKSEVLGGLTPSSLGSKSSSTGTKSSSGNSEDKNLERYQANYDKAQHEREMDELSTEEYYNNLAYLTEYYFTKNGKVIDKYKDKYQQNQEELYSISKEMAEKSAQALINAHEKAIKKIEDENVKIDLNQQLVGEDSEEYFDLEKQKYDNIIKKETELQREISRLQAIGTVEAKANAESLIETYYDTVSERYSIIKNLQDMQIESLQKQKDAIETIHDYTLDMIKEEYNAKKESYQSEIDDITKVFNAKKQALQNESDSRSYNKGLTEKSSIISDLENQLALIKNDETAIAKRKSLEEELAKAKEDLADYQYDHSIELQQNELDEELKMQTEKLESKIDAIDKTLSNEVKMRELADERIRKSGDKLFNQLISYSEEYGNITKDEITDAWDNATTSINGYSSAQESLLKTLKLVTAELSKIDSASIKDYANNSGLSTATISDTKATMQANSAKWLTSDTNTREKLAEENLKLGNSMGWYRDPVTGIWWEDETKKVRIYHEGGIVGGSGYATKSTEELAKLLKGEIVLTEPQAQKAVDMINNSNSNINISMPIVIEGNADSETVKAFEKQVNKLADVVIGKLNTARSNAGFKKKPKFV